MIEALEEYGALGGVDALGARKLPLIDYKYFALHTASDGTRYLSDRGRYPKYHGPSAFGRGAKTNGSNQFINLGHRFKTNTGSLFFTVHSLASGADYIYSNWGDDRHYIYDDAGTDFKIGLGATGGISSGVVPKIGSTYCLVHDNNTWTLFENTVEVANGTYSGNIVDQPARDAYIASRNSTTGFSSGAYSNIQNLSQVLTPTQIAYQCNFPEKFLYYEDGILKSHILSQEEIDNVVSYLPLCEIDNYVRDMVNYSEGVSNAEVTSYTTSVSGANNTNTNVDNVFTIHMETVSANTYQPYCRISNTNQDGAYYLVEAIIEITSGQAYLDFLEATPTVSFDETLTVGTYTKTFISSFASSDRMTLRFDGTVEYTFDATVTITAKKLSGTYPIANYTAAVRDDAINLTKGLQTCQWVRDALGVPTGATFDRIQCDGVGEADTGWIPDNTNDFHIEFVYDRDADYNYQAFGANRDLIRLYQSYINMKIRDVTSGNATIPSSGEFHFYSRFIASTGEHKIYINGTLELERTVGAGVASTDPWEFASSLTDAFSVFRVYLDDSRESEILARGLTYA